MSLDLGGTLISCPAWMDLELRDLIRVTFAELKKLGWHEGTRAEGGAGRVKDSAEGWTREGQEARRAQEMLAEIRERARRTLREYSAHECIREVFPRLGMAVPSPRLLEEALGRVYRALLPEVEWTPGSHDFLSSLRGAGLRLALLSNAAFAPFVEWVLQEAGVRGFFETVMVSDQTGWRKPHPRPFRELLQRLEVGPAAVCHVGDHFEQDVVGATGVGMRAIWLHGTATHEVAAHEPAAHEPAVPEPAVPEPAVPEPAAQGAEEERDGRLWVAVNDLHEAARLLLSAR